MTGRLYYVLEDKEIISEIEEASETTKKKKRKSLKLQMTFPINLKKYQILKIQIVLNLAIHLDQNKLKILRQKMN